MFQLAFRRLIIQGRLAEHLGEKAIDVDKMFREINLYGWAIKADERVQIVLCSLGKKTPPNMLTSKLMPEESMIIIKN